MKTIVTFSGGKDSLAALLYVRNNITKNFEVVFCDTGWEHSLTYNYIKEIESKLDITVTVLKSKKYDGMIDLAAKKKRFPSSQRRFCTSELKTIPMIDYILDVVKDHFVAIQGIRGAESSRRSLMRSQCNYFKYYIEPYSYTKKGKPKYHTYRRKEVLEYMKNYVTDVLRPVFHWSAMDVINYILDSGLEPNPLYRMGYKRVGCWPCVMCSNRDVLNICTQNPERIDYIAQKEQEIKSSFLGPDSIPSWAYKGEYPLIKDVTKYILAKNATGDLFDDNQETTSCMSFYGLCE